jgi:hypothetical protein
MEMTMSYHSSQDVFSSDTVSLQEKMLRLRQEIVEAQQHRLQLDAAPRAEKQLADLRISQMESKFTALLDTYSD